MDAKQNANLSLSQEGSDSTIKPDALEHVQLLRSLDELDEKLTKNKLQLNKMKITQDLTDQNHVLLECFDWLTKFSELLATFLQKENFISLFLLQNASQNKSDVKLKVPVHCQERLKQLLRNLARFTSNTSDDQDLHTILKSQSYLQSSELEQFDKSVVYFKETLQKVKQAEKFAKLNGSSLDPQLLSKFNEFASQIDCQITLMMLVLNKSFP